MLDRRSFLGLLGFIPLAVSAIARAKEKEITCRGEFYRDYEIFFTGWKGAQGNDLFVGQWLGYPIGPGAAQPRIRESGFPSLYSSCQGSNEAFMPGDQFNICLFEDQKAITWKSTEEEKAVESVKAKKKLKLMIDAIRDSGEKNLHIGEWNRLMTAKGIVRKGWWADADV